MTTGLLTKNDQIYNKYEAIVKLKDIVKEKHTEADLADHLSGIKTTLNEIKSVKGLLGRNFPTALSKKQVVSVLASNSAVNKMLPRGTTGALTFEKSVHNTNHMIQSLERMRVHKLSILTHMLERAVVTSKELIDSVCGPSKDLTIFIVDSFDAVRSSMHDISYIIDEDRLVTSKSVETFKDIYHDKVVAHMAPIVDSKGVKTYQEGKSLYNEIKELNKGIRYIYRYASQLAMPLGKLV